MTSHLRQEREVVGRNGQLSEGKDVFRACPLRYLGLHITVLLQSLLLEGARGEDDRRAIAPGVSLKGILVYREEIVRGVSVAIRRPLRESRR